MGYPSMTKEIDFSSEQLWQILEETKKFKQLKAQRIPHRYLEGLNLALLFETTSTRTRAGFTVAAQDLGMQVTFLAKHELQLGKKESITDTAYVLGSMFDGIVFRGHSQSDAEALATYSGVPVWSGLTDEWHPTKAIGDYYTIYEYYGRLKGLTVAYVGDARNNVARSFLVLGAMLGVNIKMIAPTSLQPAQEIIDLANKYAVDSTITITDDVTEVKGLDAVYTDVWVSMGENVDFKERIDALLPYQINQDLLDKTENPNLLVLHCLPAFHDLHTEVVQDLHEQYGYTELEMTDQVFQDHKEMIFNQSVNHMHAIKAILHESLRSYSSQQ